jgi:hypothetical protein
MPQKPQMFEYVLRRVRTGHDPARVRMQCHPRPRRRLVAVRDVTVKMSEHRTLAVRIPDAMAMRVAGSSVSTHR